MSVTAAAFIIGLLLLAIGWKPEAVIFLCVGIMWAALAPMFWPQFWAALGL